MEEAGQDLHQPTVLIKLKLPTEEKKEITEEGTTRNQPDTNKLNNTPLDLNHTLNYIVDFFNTNGISKNNIHIHLNVPVENTMMVAAPPTKQEETTWQENENFMRYRRQAYDKSTSSSEAPSPSSRGKSQKEERRLRHQQHMPLPLFGAR